MGCPTISKMRIVSYFPQKFSSTDDFPADCPPTTAICGRSMTMGTPRLEKASCIQASGVLKPSCLSSLVSQLSQPTLSRNQDLTWTPDGVFAYSKISCVLLWIKPNSVGIVSELAHILCNWPSLDRIWTIFSL